MKRGTPQHPKTSMLAAELGIPLYAAVGILESLWHWTAQFAKRGDVGRYLDTVIAQSIGWDRDPDALVAALLKCRWLDPSDKHRLIIHDWHEHAEDAVHIALARKVETFASGHRPSMNRLPKEERTRLLAEYERRVNCRPLVDNNSNGVDIASVHTENAQETHCLSLGHSQSQSHSHGQSQSLAPAHAPRAGGARVRDRARGNGVGLDLGKAAAKTPPPAPPPATPEVPRALDTPEFRETWSRWVEHRGEIGKPLTRTHLAAQFSRLEEWGEARALAAINFSITRGYESICEEKPNGNARKQHRGRDEYLPI